MTIKLGDRVRDKITKFEGIVIAEYRYLQGCNRLHIQPEKLKDGKPVEAQVFDVTQCELVKPGVHSIVPPMEDKPGGPQPEPQRRPDPKR